MLATLGVAAVGCTASSAFTEGDAHRFTALSHLTPAVPESLDPVLPAPPGPTPLGPISHNTLSAQQQSPGAPLHMERQRSGSLAGPTTSAASRGRPAKEPKLSGMGTGQIQQLIPYMHTPWCFCPCRCKVYLQTIIMVIECSCNGQKALL